jgi:glycerophosphoryl diester phosphodiesterase
VTFAYLGTVGMRSEGARLVRETPISRRAALSLLGGAAVVSAVGACTTKTPSVDTMTVARWVSERGEQYLVGHRGSGDVVPEHTLEAYEAALSWGAKALEISVVQTKDRVLFCQHDLTFDRTTTLTGAAADIDSSRLASGRVAVPRLGPRWLGAGAPRIARLNDVLDRVGHRAVLCIEAKDNAAYPAVVDLLEKKGLKDSAVIKLHATSSRFTEARGAGYPIFGYLGSFAETTVERVRELASKLDPQTDYLVIPGNENGEWLSEAVVKTAVATRVPVWVFGVHRRSELQRHHLLGAVGAVGSSVGYLSGRIAPVREAGWGGEAISPGEMTRRPESDNYGLRWPGDGSVGLGLDGRQAFLTLGHMAPLRQAMGPYQVDIEVRVDVMPSQGSASFSLAFGHGDDRYYEHRQGQLDGYHALLRMDGTLELWSHSAGMVDGRTLGPAVPGPTPKVGTWVPLRLTVTPSEITWSRLDTGAVIVVEDHRFRGDYIHVGLAATDGRISLRRLGIT